VVVESVGRTGIRSRFSNIDGHLSAPGEGILSAFSYNNFVPSDRSYGVSSGTSMAAPHVTALLPLMQPYNPNLTSQQAVDIIRRTATRDVRAAPRIDAFAAMLEASGDSLKDLADLNNDGVVDMKDFEIFRAALRQVEGRGTAPPTDL